MSDLIERLDTITATVKETVEEAADEIERLQAVEAALIGHNLALQESVERLERELAEAREAQKCAKETLEWIARHFPMSASTRARIRDVADSLGEQE